MAAKRQRRTDRRQEAGRRQEAARIARRRGPQTVVDGDFATEHASPTLADQMPGGPEGIVETESPEGLAGMDRYRWRGRLADWWRRLRRRFRTRADARETKAGERKRKTQVGERRRRGSEVTGR